MPITENADPKRFAPYDIGDKIIMFNGPGAITGDGEGSSDVFQVTAAERLPVLGKGGAIAIWAHASASDIPKPFAADPGIVYGTLAAGGGNASPQVQSLNPLKGQLIVWRTLVRVLGTLPGGLVVDDINVYPSMPTSVTRWTLSTANAQGYMNYKFQFGLPTDRQVDAGTGQNIGYQTAYVGVDPWEEAYMTQLAVYGQNNQPSYTISNDNASTASASGMAIGLSIRGFLYNVHSLPKGSGNNTYKLGSTDIHLPDGVRFEDCWRIQTSGRQTQSQ